METCPLVPAFGNHDAGALWADEDAGADCYQRRLQKPASTMASVIVVSVPHGEGSVHMCDGTANAGRVGDQFWNSKRCHAH